MSDNLSLELTHYSNKILTPDKLDDRPQKEKPHFKPYGFWVSVKGEDDWYNWCKENEFRDIDSQYEHKVTLTDNDNILYLESALDICCFTERHRNIQGLGIHERCWNPDWKLVAAEYDGIIIAPYQWSCRMDSENHWYYPWDCASGCIWNMKNAVQSIELLDNIQDAEPREQL